MQINLCLVAFMFMGASIYTMMKCDDCPPFASYKASMDETQKVLYQAIVDERKKLYLQGLGLGFGLSFLYLFMFKKTLNPFAHACIFATIILLTQYLYYMLMPKSAYMLPMLKGKDQVNEWLKVYREMQLRYHLGMLFGAIGYFILAVGLSK